MPGETWAERVNRSSGSMRGKPRPRATPGLSRSDSTPSSSSTTPRDESSSSSSSSASPTVSQPQTTSGTSVVAGQPPIPAPPAAPGNVWAIRAAAAKAKSEQPPVAVQSKTPVNVNVDSLAKSTAALTVDSGRDSSSSNSSTPRAWGNSSSPSVTPSGSGGSSSSSTPKKGPSAKDPNQLTVIAQKGNNVTLVGPTATDRSRIRPLRPVQEPKTEHCGSIRVRANHFPVTFIKKSFPQTVYHYDVVIVPKESKDKENASLSELSETTVPDRLLHTVWQKFEAQYHAELGARMPFDGRKNCYTMRPLEFRGNCVWSGEIRMIDPDDDDKFRTFRVQLKFANEIPTGIMWTYLSSERTRQRIELPQEVIQALDVALRYSPSLRYTPCNRSFYASANPHRISDLLELWFGHNQSLLLGRSEKASLNVDMANKAFIKAMPVADLFDIVLGKKKNKLTLNEWTPHDFKRGNDFLKGKLLQYGTGRKINGKYEKSHRFVCVGIQERNASFVFQINGVKTTIQDYFEESKKIKLEHPDWPVVHVGNKNMTNYVPLELLDITPQAYKGKLEAVDTSEMIKGAAKPPPDRFRRIKASRDGSGFENCSIMDDFGMRVEKNMLEMDAKLLPLPKITFKSRQGDVSKTPPYNDGKSKVEKFLRPAKVPSIAVVNAAGKFTQNCTNDIRKFLESLGREAENVGMTALDTKTPVRSLFAEAKVFDVKAVAVRAISSDLMQKTRDALTRIKNLKYGLVIVLIGKDGNEYPTVKAEAEVKVGILTQCVKWSTLSKVCKGGGNQVLFNILLKINAKLGGVNFELSSETTREFNFLHEPIMFLGADVTHPAPNSKSPSIAAITASYDLSGICYQMHIQAQKRKDEDPLMKDADKEKEKVKGANEVIDGIDIIIAKMIRDYRKHNHGKWPARIVMFRDGVSEGQFPAIKESEYYNGIKKACDIIASGNSEFRPKITFVVVKKRHHTRFMPVNERDGVKPKYNVPPGTVIDHTITHPTESEFFLTSHVGIQGTSKPTRYHVIHDDNNFSMHLLEKLTYYLCYTFVRCTQPVSYPAPTFYAHLAAFRARALLENNGSEIEETFEQLKKRMVIHADCAKYPMFFI